MIARHVPERTCVACRAAQPKRAMVRIVRTPTGNVVVDSTGKLSGRGAYLCRRKACWALGLRKDALQRALKTVIAPTDRVVLEEYGATLPGAEATAGAPRKGVGDEPETG